MSVTATVLAACGWMGTAMLLDAAPWFRDVPLHQRLAPYRPDRASTPAHPRALTGLVDLVADRTARTLGGRTALPDRLVRAGVTATAEQFRTRRFASVVTVSAVTGACAAATRPGWAAACALTAAAAVGVVTTEELWLLARARRRAEQVRGELPVVSEQLGMLLSAGYSLPAALQRLSQRGSGLVADGFGEVVRRLRHGQSEIDALTWWAGTTGVEGAERLVRVLTIHRQAGDLGHLISDEARAVRAEHHRALLESIARRGELVWIPVTVATLVPGLVVLAVPFASAMSQITGQGGAP